MRHRQLVLGLRRRVRRLRGDGGFMALELAVLTPFVIAAVLLVVGFGRVAHGRQLVDQAAAVSARAAALANSAGQAQIDGHAAAAGTLAQTEVSCTALQVSVDTTAFVPGGQVEVTVSCTADLSGLALSGLPGSMTMTATARAPLETYRDIGLGFRDSEALSGGTG